MIQMKPINSRSGQRKLPYHYYSITVLILLIIGLVDTAYLVYSHYQNYTDITFSSFCAISNSINCDTVAQSPWSILGGLPVALWGLFGYALFLIVLIPLFKETHKYFPLWKLLFALASLYSLISLFFAYISLAKIHSFCILCIAIYGINFALTFQTWIICRRYELFPFFKNNYQKLFLVFSQKIIYWPIFVLLCLALLVKLFLPHYWELEPAELTIDVPSGITENGHPWIGATPLILTIEEFSDYMCFQCYKMHYTLRQLIKKYPNKIRLVHRHYPMDHEFNPIVVPNPFPCGFWENGHYWQFMPCTQGKFWEMNDALFQLGSSKEPFNTKYLAEETNIPAQELTLALSDSLYQKAAKF